MFVSQAAVRNIRMGIKTLLLHKLRAMLTMLGVVFGVASVIAMLAVGEGASQEALEQIRKLGSTNIIISSVKPADDESSGGAFWTTVMYGLEYDDEIRARDSFAAIQHTVPVKVVRQEARIGQRTMELRVVGTTPQWFELVRRPMIAGQRITWRHAEGRDPVVVLTEYGARRLLATEQTIGRTLRIGGLYYEVIGIVQSEGGQGSSVQTPDQEVDAYIPIQVARERYGDMITRRAAGSFMRESVELHHLIVQVATIADVEPTARGLQTMLARFHPEGDFRISVPLALLRQAEATKRTFNVVLGSIAGISLLVGGIGIMNIMLASVTERTREIGVRRAIGAKKNQIIAQFLVETMVLSTAGGLLGVAIGVAIPWVITQAVGMPTVVTAWSLALAVGISVSVGVVFGLYPARQAANLDPIEALRHE